MIIQDRAKEIIYLVSMKLDPILRVHGFTNIIRESQPSIFSEHLIYDKIAFRIEIIACLHPHNYPYFLEVSFIKKIEDDWEYYKLEDLIPGNESLFPISTDDQLNQTLINLAECMEKILAV